MWLLRNRHQPHAGFVRRAVSFFVVALHAGAGEIFPCVIAAARTRDDVINGKGRMIISTILASESITPEDVLAREFDLAKRNTQVGRESDDGREGVESADAANNTC